MRKEEQEQIIIFEWASMMSSKYPELEYLNASLNGLRLTIGQAVKAKRLGMKKGFPDINLPVLRRGKTSLYIELKVDKNKPSTEQIKWNKFLNDHGHLAVFCWGSVEAIEVIKNYLDIT